ncbi:MAG: hypothetical protein WCP34_08415 [Pseudomonadota bacterium]
MENPFLVLPIPVSASQSDILREVTLAMRARRHDAKKIALAQRILFDPLTRVIAEFRYRLDIESLLAGLPIPEISAREAIFPLLDPFTER